MKKLSIVLGSAVLFGLVAPVMKAQDQEPDYLRSSLYTILIKSDKQNAKIDKENNEADANGLLSMAKGFANTDAKKAANDTHEGSLASIPGEIFQTIAIPDEFNNHNVVGLRIIEFDSIVAGISEDQMNAAKEAYGMKKKSRGGFGGLMKGLAASTVNSAAGANIIEGEDGPSVDDYAPAVLQKFLADNNIPALMVAEWYSYNPEGEEHWSTTTIDERAGSSLSVAEQAQIESGASASKIAGMKAFNLIPNTFLLATNLKFQSNKAILAKAQAAADAAASMFGSYGSLVSSVGGAIAGAAAGDGFRVTADSYLFRLKWNPDVQDAVEEIAEKNGTLQDLIDAGVCTLEFVGKEGDHANVRQSIFSDKPISSLVERATTRAIDKSINKLQERHEEFRSIFPISSYDADGTFKVKIGTRQGVSKGDQYNILEKVEDPATGAITYKKVGDAKPNEKLIWNNVAGADEEAAENAKKSEGKSADFNNDAVNLGATTFVGKKGKDYTGMYVQLKKKK